MRKLVFNGTHAQVFKHLYFGFLEGGNRLSKDNGKPRHTVQLEARIQRKFDELVEDDPTDRNLPFRLKADGGELLLTSEEYQHIDKCIDAVPWPTTGAKWAATMLDLWGDAEKTTE